MALGIEPKRVMGASAWLITLALLCLAGLCPVGAADPFGMSSGGVEYGFASVGSGDCKTGSDSGSHTGITSYSSTQATLEDCMGLCADTALCIGVQYTAACNQNHAANSCFLYTGPGDFVTDTNGASCSECMQVTNTMAYAGADASVSPLVEIGHSGAEAPCTNGAPSLGNTINLKEVDVYDAQDNEITAVSAHMLPMSWAYDAGNAGNYVAANCVDGTYNGNFPVCHSKPTCSAGYYGGSALRIRYAGSVTAADVSSIVVTNRWVPVCVRCVYFLAP